MKRLLVNLLFFLAALSVQIGFIASLPGFLSYAPLVFSVGVFLIQHIGSRSGVYWIVGFGLVLDALSLSAFPAEVLSYAAAAAVAYASARYLFSNRSWYGLIACGAASVLSMGVVRAAILGTVLLRHPERVSWGAFGGSVVWNLLLTAVLLTILFLTSKRLRTRFLL